MNHKVTIIDYGIGNLLSVARAFEYCGATVHFASSNKEIESAERLVLPGVGAFSDGMAELINRGFDESIKIYAKTGKPFLGICLGMQMMLDKSEEFGNYQGLGLISGEVVAIPNIDISGKPQKIPHIGWNELLPVSVRQQWDNTILSGIQNRDSVYFVHSYMSVPTNPAVCLADCDYNGHRISAVINSENLYACQFHPEKSGLIGLSIIKNFITI